MGFDSKRYEKEYFSNIVKNSSNFTDVARNLGMSVFCGNRKTIKKYISLYDLNIDHFDKGLSNFNKSNIKRPLSDVLVVESTYTHTSSLKERLYKEGLKQRICELCGQGEMWNGKKMSLILDHVNGFSNDNRLENLRIVCPNCNATLSTHGGRNIKNKNEAVV